MAMAIQNFDPNRKSRKSRPRPHRRSTAQILYDAAAMRFGGIPDAPRQHYDPQIMLPTLAYELVRHGQLPGGDCDELNEYLRSLPVHEVASLVCSDSIKRLPDRPTKDCRRALPMLMLFYALTAGGDV